MNGAIVIVWWMGLLGALAATVAVLKQVTLVLAALRDIHRLAGLTRDAARGIAANVAVVSRLAETEAPAGELRAAAGDLAAAAASLEQKASRLAAGASPSGG